MIHHDEPAKHETTANAAVDTAILGGSTDKQNVSNDIHDMDDISTKAKAAADQKHQDNDATSQHHDDNQKPASQDTPKEEVVHSALLHEYAND